MEYSSWFGRSAAILAKRDLENWNGTLYEEDIKDLIEPRLRNSMVDTYLLVLIAFGTLSLLGSLLNGTVIYTIYRYKLYRDSTFGYFVNLALADAAKCILVIPLSQTSLLIQNWIFGAFLCYFLPVLQDVPAHVTMLTLLMIVFDRHLFLRNPEKTRLSEFVFSASAWFAAICIALPYPLYTTYVDLKEHGNISNAEGIGICLFSLEKDLREYSRFIFIAMFVMPVGLITFLFVKIRQTLDKQCEPIIVREIESISPSSPHYDNNYCTNSNRGIFKIEAMIDNDASKSITPDTEMTSNRSFVSPHMTVERRMQKYMLLLFLTHVFCFGPLSLLSKVVQLNSQETYENSDYLDKLFAVLVWIGFIPTVINPTLLLYMIATSRFRIIMEERHYDTSGKNANTDRGNDKEINVTYISRQSCTASTYITSDVDEEHSHIQFSSKFN